MSAIIRVHGLANGAIFVKTFWLEGYDLNIEPALKESLFTPDGGAIVNGAFGGSIFLTPDRAKARRFADNGEAIAAWNTQSTMRPFRPDGRPNKPLTALTIEVEPA